LFFDLYTSKLCKKKLFHTLFTLFVLPQGELTSRQDLGSQNRGDAAHAQRLSSFVKSLDELLQMWLDGAVLILHGPVTQVLSHAKAP